MHFTGNNLAFKKINQLSIRYCNWLTKLTVVLKKILFTLGIFIDLSKAFYSVDHKILITKLGNNGAKGNNLQWLKSYLENHK